MITDTSPSPASEQLRSAIDGERWNEVVTLFQTRWSELITDDLPIVGEALDRLPDSILSASPRWVAAKAFVEHRLRGADSVAFRNVVPEFAEGSAFDRISFLTLRMSDRRARGDLAGALEDLQQAQGLVERASESERTVAQYGLPLLLGQWARVYELADDPINARSLLQESFDLSSWVEDDVSARHAAGRLAWLDAVEGRHDSASMWNERAAKLPSKSARLDTELHLARALKSADLLEFERAAEEFEAGSRADMHPESWASVLFLEAHIGDVASAPGDLDRLLAAEATHPKTLTHTGQPLALITHAKVRLYLLTGDAVGALLSTDDLPSTPAVQVARAAALLANDQNQAVVSIAQEVHPQVARQLRWRSKLYAVEAVALARLGVDDAAITATRRAIESVERLGLLSSLTLLSRDDLQLLARLVGADPSEQVFARVLAFASARDHVPVSSLTERERVVLSLIVQGRSSAEIATELFVSRNTVKTQTASIYRKLGVASRTELITLARTLPPDPGN